MLVSSSFASIVFINKYTVVKIGGKNNKQMFCQARHYNIFAWNRMDELGFYVPSTVFQSFRDDGRVNMKGSVQCAWNRISPQIVIYCKVHVNSDTTHIFDYRFLWRCSYLEKSRVWR